MKRYLIEYWSTAVMIYSYDVWSRKKGSDKSACYKRRGSSTMQTPTLVGQWMQGNKTSMLLDIDHLKSSVDIYVLSALPPRG